MGKKVAVKLKKEADPVAGSGIRDLRRSSKSQSGKPAPVAKVEVKDKPISQMSREELEAAHESIQRKRLEILAAAGGEAGIRQAVRTQATIVESAGAQIEDLNDPGKGLGKGDGLEMIARALNLPMPEDPRVELPGGERKELATVWAEAAGPKPAPPVEKPRTEQPQRLAVGTKIDVSFDEEKRRPLKFEEVPKDQSKSNTLHLDDDPISRALGVHGWWADKSWPWLREPSSNPAVAGKKLKVSRFYFHQELTVKVVVDYLPASRRADYERRIKELLCLQHGIAYLGVMPDQQANKGQLLEAIKRAMTVQELLASQQEAVAA